MDENQLKLFLRILFEKVEIYSSDSYRAQLHDVRNLIKDPKDLPFLALAVSQKAVAIWSQDPHFRQQNMVPTVTNIDLLRLAGISKS